jgi:hypothetical protein
MYRTGLCWCRVQLYSLNANSSSGDSESQEHRSLDWMKQHSWLNYETARVTQSNQLQRKLASSSSKSCRRVWRDEFLHFFNCLQFLFGMKLGLSTYEEHVDSGCLRTGRWEEYLDLGGRTEHKGGWNCVMKCFTIYTHLQVLLGWSFQEGWDEWGTIGREEIYIQGSGWRTFRKEVAWKT